MLMKTIFTTVAERNGINETTEKAYAREKFVKFLEERGIPESEFEELLNEFDAEAEFHAFCIGFRSGVEVMVSKS